MRTLKLKPSRRKLLAAILCVATSIAMIFNFYIKIISSVVCVKSLANVKTCMMTERGIDAKTLQMTSLYKINRAVNAENGYCTSKGKAEETEKV